MMAPRITHLQPARIGWVSQFAGLIAIACSSWPALAVSTVPADLQGIWVPQSQPCSKATVSLDVGPEKASIKQQGRIWSFEKLLLCYTCEGGTKYQGMVVWMSPVPDVPGPAAFTVYFNEGEQRGVARVELSQQLKGIALQQVVLRNCSK